MNELGGPQNCARQSHSADVMCQISQGLRARAPDNVADGEADQTVKPITAPHTFRLVFSFSRDDLLLSYFYFIDLAPNVLNALPPYRNKEYPSIRATTRTISLPYTTLRYYLSGGVSRATSYISY